MAIFIPVFFFSFSWKIHFGESMDFCCCCCCYAQCIVRRLHCNISIDISYVISVKPQRIHTQKLPNRNFHLLYWIICHHIWFGIVDTFSIVSNTLNYQRTWTRYSIKIFRPNENIVCVLNFGCVCVVWLPKDICVSLFVRKFMSILMDEINAIERKKQILWTLEITNASLSCFRSSQLNGELKPFECVCHHKYFGKEYPAAAAAANKTRKKCF